MGAQLEMTWNMHAKLEMNWTRGSNLFAVHKNMYKTNTMSGKNTEEEE